MANRAIALAAPVAATAVLALMALGLLPLIGRTELGEMAPADWAALRFTLVQAGLSAFVSCALAVPLARALHRRRFRGRGVLLRLLSAPFVLPVLAAVMGILAWLGPAGLLNSALGWAGVPSFSIFGLGGVVLAHVFLNLPLATRIVLQGWASIPAERFRLAQSLGLGALALQRHIEWPMLRALLPSTFAAVFLICLTSFAAALILGGGPRASTIELGIYQSLRFQFDLDRAARLALVQVCLGVIAVIVVALLWRAPEFGAGLDRSTALSRPKGWARAMDGLIIALASAFLILPMLAVVAKGLSQAFDLPTGFFAAAFRSVLIAVASGFLASVAALALARARAKGAGLWAEAAAMAPLGSSALALGTGAFLALLPWVPPQNFAITLAVLFNAAFALPFVFRLLLPACREINAGFGRLSIQLGLEAGAEMRWLFLPRLRRPLGFGMGLAAAMAMGEFGVIALFGVQEQTVLPILIARLMGAYQMQAAAAVTLWLVVITFALFWIFDAIGGRDADT